VHRPGEAPTVPLYVFLVVQTDRVLALARAKATAAGASRDQGGQFEYGPALFLAQLADTLCREQELAVRTTSAEIIGGAALHGRELSRAGVTVAQVVHEYRDLGAAIVELAIDLGSPISSDEFRTLDRCLDDAVAQAVTEYDRQHEIALSRPRRDRLGFYTHELRGRLAEAMIAFESLETGKIGIASSTGAVFGRSLLAMRALTDRSLAEVRLAAGILHREKVPLGEIMEEVGLAASLEADTRHLQLTVEPVAPDVVIDVDRHLIAAALADVLHNGFESSTPGGHVVLRTGTPAAGRVLIEVEDECPLEQLSGPGLAIARRSVESSGGELRVRLREQGCVYTIDLPRVAVAPPPDSGRHAAASA